jgi:hypothetical protein
MLAGLTELTLSKNLLERLPASIGAAGGAPASLRSLFAPTPCLLCPTAFALACPPAPKRIWPA